MGWLQNFAAGAVGMYLAGKFVTGDGFLSKLENRALAAVGAAYAARSQSGLAKHALTGVAAGYTPAVIDWVRTRVGRPEATGGVNSRFGNLQRF